MFCINCGRKLNPGAVRCPKCGGEPAPADYCGGFWKLTETRAPAPTAAPVSAAPAVDPAAAAAAAAADEALIRQQQELLADAQRQILAGKRRERSLRSTAILLGAALFVMVVALIFSLASGGRDKTDTEPKSTPKVIQTEQPTTQPEQPEQPQQTAQQPQGEGQTSGETEKDTAQGDTANSEQPEESVPGADTGAHGRGKGSATPTPTVTAPPAPDGAN